MTIRRLRPAYDADTLKQVYAQQYDHTHWDDHIQRVQATLNFIHEWTTSSQRRIVADLSCGDAAIARGIQDTRLVILGDYVENDEYAYHGQIEHTIDLIGYVDLFVLSETLEHIDGPHQLLNKIRQHATHVVITTPLDEQDEGNPEHYWGWDNFGMLDILEQTGWKSVRYEPFVPQVPQPYYTYQMWLATSG
jgi:hypothetical protein